MVRRIEKNYDMDAIVDMLERMRKCSLVQSGQCTEKEVEENPELWKSRFRNKDSQR